MTRLTWREQAVAAFLSAQDGLRRVTGTDQSLTALNAALDVAEPLIRADERQKVYDELGHDHYVIFTEDRWTVEHSVQCRLSGRMHECSIHSAIAAWADTYEPAMSGRWRVVSADGPVPVLERADGKPR